MSRTNRWWNKHKNFIRLTKDRSFILKCKDINPFYFRHELKFLRVKMHRALRRGNKIRLIKGWEIESEEKTNGWLTH